MREYTTVEEIENYLLVTIDNAFTSQIKTWIEDMSEYIEGETGRVFEADDVATEKIYETQHTHTVELGDYHDKLNTLYVDEFVSGSNSLSIAGTLVATDDYIFYPINTNPKMRVKLTDTSGLTYDVGEQNIQFEACWGFSETCPRPIKFACTVFVSGIILNSLSQEGELASVTIGRYTASYRDKKQMNDFDRATEILTKYTKVLI